MQIEPNPRMPGRLAGKFSLHRLRKDEKGIAAVEFALILPLMLTLYLGSSEVTNGVLASRKLSIVARTLSDIVAQQSLATSPECTQTGVCNATMTAVFGSAQKIMSPFSGTSLQMTVSSIDIKAKSTSPAAPTGKVYNNLVAVMRWSKTAPTPTGGTAATPRSCTTLLLPVVAGTAPALTNLPQGLYSTGGIIIADVAYTYTPTFGGVALTSLQGGGQTITPDTTPGYAMKNTTYMRPRNWTTFVPYDTGGTPNCTAPSSSPDPTT